MVAAHVLAARTPDGELTLTSRLVDGRASALFAVLAGVSLALMSGRRTPLPGPAMRRVALGLAVRALLVALLGLGLGELDTGIAVILTYYGVLFLLGLPFLALRARPLLLLALAWAVAARAMAAEVAAHHGGRTEQRLRSLHCMFVAPVPSGEVEADVTLLRSGRTQSHARVDLHGAGASSGLIALGAFGAPRPGYRFAGLTPPPAPPPHECPSFRDPPPPESGWDRASGEAPPPLPAEVVERTRARYVEAYELLTGERW